MESLTIELVSNASGKLFPDNTFSSFTNFLPEQVNLEGQWEVAISEISYPSMYQNITEGKFKFLDRELSKSTLTYSTELGLYTSITDIVEAMNTSIQERNNHNETCKTVKVSRRTQKVVVMLANDNSGHAFCSTDLGHIFGNNVGNAVGVLMIGKGPHETEFAYDVVRIYSLMIYSDIVEYNIVGDKEAPLPLKKEINKNLFSKADSLVDKILSCPPIKLSNSQTLILDGVESGIFLSEFTQQRGRKNADLPNNYFTLLDAAGMSPTLILNQNGKAKERRSGVPFKI